MWRCEAPPASHCSIEPSFLLQLHTCQGEKLLCSKSSSFHLYSHWCKSVFINEGFTTADDPEGLTLHFHPFSIHLENELGSERLYFSFSWRQLWLILFALCSAAVRCAQVVGDETLDTNTLHKEKSPSVFLRVRYAERSSLMIARTLRSHNMN